MKVTGLLTCFLLVSPLLICLHVQASFPKFFGASNKSARKYSKLEKEALGESSTSDKNLVDLRHSSSNQDGGKSSSQSDEYQMKNRISEEDFRVWVDFVYNRENVDKWLTSPTEENMGPGQKQFYEQNKTIKSIRDLLTKGRKGSDELHVQLEFAIYEVSELSAVTMEQRATISYYFKTFADVASLDVSTKMVFHSNWHKLLGIGPLEDPQHEEEDPINPHVEILLDALRRVLTN